MGSDTPKDGVRRTDSSESGEKSSDTPKDGLESIDAPGAGKMGGQGKDTGATQLFAQPVEGGEEDLDELLKRHLSDKYEIITELGRGGMAVVYKARHLGLDRMDALKILPQEYSFDEEFVKRFHHEARMSASLDHANIVRIYDVDQAGPINYFSMQFVDGKSLSSMIEDGEISSIDEAVFIAQEVSKALSYAHSGGIVHRDIKPDNIMLDSQHRVLVTDFGIAKAASGVQLTTPKGVAIGTPQYMSPEQARGKPVDGRSDIYCLGVALYEMLTGEVPFKSDDATALMYQHVHDIPTEPKKINPSLPDGLNKIVMKCLEKKPEDRFQNADDLSNSLETADFQIIESGEGPVVIQQTEAATTTAVPRRAPTTPTRRVRVEEKSKTKLFAIAGAVIVAVLAIAGFYIWNQQKEAEEKAVSLALTRKQAREDSLRFAKREAERLEQARQDSVKLAEAERKAKEGEEKARMAELRRQQEAEARSSAEVNRQRQLAANMILIGSGEFMMGANDGDPDEGPAHKVYLNSFYIDKNEVTVSDYEKFILDTGRRDPRYWDDSKFNGSNHPVIGVSGQDANDYCEWAGKRLPTEAEWEKAARGTGGQKYPWGNSAPDAGGKYRANYDPGSYDEDGYRFTAPILSFADDKSPYGVLGMAGNAKEWVSDWYSEEYYKDTSNRNPKGPTSGREKVLRGGSWYYASSDLRTTYRYRDNPGRKDNTYGFRCAKSK